MAVARSLGIERPFPPWLISGGVIGGAVRLRMAVDAALAKRGFK
jgi:hypothetical protein